MCDPSSPAELFAETAIAVETLFFMLGAMLLVSHAFTTGLITKMPDTAMQTATYNQLLLVRRRSSR
jgi:hypothetical protein